MNCYEIESEMYEAMSSDEPDDNSTTPNEEETKGEDE